MKVAILAAGAAILAAAVGGLASCYGTREAVSAELRREQEAEEAQAMGAARLLMSELVTAATQMAIMHGDRLYRPLDPSYRIEVPQDDMRLIFSRLTPNEWGEVTIALNNLQGLEAFVRSMRSDGVRRLDQRALRLVKGDIDSAMAAAETLKRIANAEQLDVPIEFYGGE